MSAARATMPTRSAVDGVLDEGWLTRALGRPARASRLRVKPGVAVIIGLEDPGSGLPAGWARLLWPVSHAKAAKARRRAVSVGASTGERRLPGRVLLQSGGLASDPALAKHLRRAHDLGLLGAVDPAEVLRHNPLRRLVAAHGDAVVRVSAASQAPERELRESIRHLVPLPEEVGASSRRAHPHIGALHRVGDTDLSGEVGPGAHRGAGRLLAALHAGTGELPRGLADRLGSRRTDLRAQVRAHLTVLDLLAPELAGRLRDLWDRLPGSTRGAGGGRVLLHGDASPDQVLTDRGSGRLWLIDFERARLGPAADDLGSYLAACAPGAGEHLLAGYEEAAGALPDDEELERAVIRSHLMRLVDPLRRADPAWREAVGVSLGRMEEGLR